MYTKRLVNKAVVFNAITGTYPFTFHVENTLNTNEEFYYINICSSNKNNCLNDAICLDGFQFFCIHDRCILE